MKSMRKIPFILFSITLFYLLSNFLAPLMLEPGTVNHLDANANRVDYWDNDNYPPNNGYYEFELEEGGEYTIVAEKEGYRRYEEEIFVDQGKENAHTIYMKKDGGGGGTRFFGRGSHTRSAAGDDDGGTTILYGRVKDNENLEPVHNVKITVEGKYNHSYTTLFVSWKEMMAEGHVYEGFVYIFGDLNCHQKHSRSYEVHGNQMPICTRDVGIFLGGTVGFFILFFVTPRTDFYQTFFSALPSKFQERLFSRVSRKQLFFLILVTSVVPTGFDGVYQMVSDYESTNFTRIVTGFIFGIPTALAFGAFLMAGVHDDYLLPEPSRVARHGNRRQLSFSSPTSLAPPPSPLPSTSPSPCMDSKEIPPSNKNTLIEREGKDNGAQNAIEQQKNHKSAEPGRSSGGTP